MGITGDAAAALQRATSVEEVGRIVRTAARSSAGADGATFVLRDGERCFYADEDAIGPLWKGQRFPLDDCITGWAMLNAETTVVPDIELDPRIPLAVYRPTFVRSLVAVPIGRPAPVGAIGVYWSVTGAASAERAVPVERVAHLAAAAIERIGLADAPWAPNFRLPGASVRPHAG